VESQKQVNDFGVFDAGWRCWAGFHGTTMIHRKRPYDYVEIEIWRDGWDDSKLVEPYKMPPMMNVADLWWRPAGPLRLSR